MDNKAYLQQISAPRPYKPQKSFKVPKKLIAILLVPIFLMTAWGIISNFMTTLANKEILLLKTVDLKIENLSKVLDDYTKLVKDPNLRAKGTTLANIATGANNDLKAAIQVSQAKKAEAVNLTDEILAEEANNLSKLQLNLDNAKQSGLLDRKYQSEMTYQVALIISLLSEVNARTGDANIKNITESSLSNLNAIHHDLATFVVKN